MRVGRDLKPFHMRPSLLVYEPMDGLWEVRPMKMRPARGVSAPGERRFDGRAAMQAGSPDLWIREFTREAKFSVRLVLDRRASESELSRRRFEENVSACAAVAWKLTQEGADVTLATDERTLVCRAGERVYELLGYLALVESTGLGGPEPPIGADPEAEYVFGMADESSRPSSSVPQGARGRRTARR